MRQFILTVQTVTLIYAYFEPCLKIREKKRDAYAEFLKDFTEGAVSIMHDIELDQVEADRQRMHARNQLLLYASDKVIKAYDSWVKYTDENPDRGGDTGDVALFGKLLVEIRKDILEGKSKLTIGEIENLNPFSRG